MELPSTIATEEDNMKDKRELMAEAIEAWANEDLENRSILVLFGDKKLGVTTCGMIGVEQEIVSATVNEMLSDEEAARIILNSVSIYNEILKEEKEKAEKKEEHKEKSTKIYS